MVNKVTLIGRVGSINPQAKFTGVSIATNESVKDKNGKWSQKTTWHNVTLFGPQAESFNKFVKVGDLLLVEGKLSYNEKDDKVYTNIPVSHYKRLSPAPPKEADSEKKDISNDDDLPF